MARTLYRIVQTDPPQLMDFLSNRAKGLPPRGPEVSNPETWEGISVFDSWERAERVAHRWPQIGTYIAELRIPDDAPARIVKTFGPGHYTLWGDASLLLSLVMAVSRVR